MAVLVCKQISYSSLKNEITEELISFMYIYLNVCNEINDVELLLLQ